MERCWVTEAEHATYNNGYFPLFFLCAHLVKLGLPVADCKQPYEFMSAQHKATLNAKCNVISLHVMLFGQVNAEFALNSV